MNRTKLKLWTGRVLSSLAMLVMAGSAWAKLAHTPAVVSGLTRTGLPESSILPIAIVELLCVALYLWPRTAIVGTLLVTGYLGGAVVVQIISRLSILLPLAVGTMALAGTYLRIAPVQRIILKTDSLRRL